MPDVEARLDRMAQAIESLAGVTGELVRENRTLVEIVTVDRTALRETLRDLNGFVATAGVALERLERQVGRLAEITGAGFTRLQLVLKETTRETHRLIEETTRETQRLIEETTRETRRLIADNNRLIAENNDAIRRMIEKFMRGRGNGDAAPA